VAEGLSSDLLLSIDRWNEYYRELSRERFEETRAEYQRDYMQDTMRQFLGEIDPKAQRRFLEIGCGPGFLGAELARQGYEVYGIDFCMEALKLARRTYQEAGVDARFAAGDLHHLPLADSSVDMLYGGGVIEHFDDTLGVLKECHRVLAPGGVSYNTIPYCSPFALLYRQKHGNIPDLPILKPLFEFIHLKVLGGRHMAWGYEKSFTRARMRSLHLSAGFADVVVKPFMVHLPLLSIPSALRPLARSLANGPLMLPTIAVVARKAH
jgi:ubiquinone/menaquinone biosynthesis C-methylase UbiE